MKRVPFILAILVFAVASAMNGAGLDGSVFLMPVDSRFASVGSAEYFDDLMRTATATLTGTHTVTGPVTFRTTVDETDGTYSYTLEGPADPGACYGTSLYVKADPPGLFNSKEATWTGETRCAPTASQGSTTPVDNPTYANAPTCGDPGQCSPIVLNLGSGTYQLTDVDDGVEFDLAGSGTPLRTSWTTAGEPIGFLALDRNGNGRIDSGAELFGNATRLRDGRIAPNGFIALAEFDLDRDGLIDSADGAWNALLVWTDINHNGASEPTELQSLAAAGLTQIALEHHWSGRVDTHGNAFRYQGRFSIASMSRPSYDVWFVTR